jgi:hypothetical protein
MIIKRIAAARICSICFFYIIRHCSAAESHYYIESLRERPRKKIKIGPIIPGGYSAILE